MNPSKNKQTTHFLTGVNYLVPNAICKLIASATILINLYWSKNQQVQLMGMGVGTLFSFVFGYLIIISLNLSLAHQIGRSRDIPNDIGIYYQRALVINFIICAFLITPLLYVSKKIVILFVHIDEPLAVVISQYLFQLVPSIYLFAFYDTTQTFLLAQGHFLAALVINIFGFFCHFFLISHLGAAWSKNLTDLGRCASIYLYLTLKQKKLKSWSQWTILCFKGWENHLKYYKDIGLTTYAQTFFLFFFGVIGYRLERFQLICHICFINILQMILIINIGLKQGLIIKLSYYIKIKKIKNTREVGSRSIKIFFIVSLAIVFLMLMYIQEIDNFFVSTVPSKEIFKQKYWLLIISIIIDSLNFSLSTMVQVFNKHYPLLKYQIIFSICQALISYFFCYKLDGQLSGLWYGWILCSALNSVLNWMMLLRNQNSQNRWGNNKYEALLKDNKEQRIQADF